MAGTLALTKAELMRLLRNRRYFIFTLAFPVVLYLLIGRQVSALAYGVAFARLLHDLDGHVRRVQRRAERQRAADLAGEEGRLDPPAQAHPAAAERLRGQQGARLAGDHRAVDRDRAAARPLLRQRPPAGLGVAGHRGHRLVRLDDLRRAGRGHRLPVRAGAGAAGHVRHLLRLRHPRRPVVPAGRLPRQDRPVHPDLRGRQDRHRRDPGRHRAAGLPIGLVVWLGIFTALATLAVRATAETV